MINFFRILFKKDPPMDKYIDYGEYQIRWRRDWWQKVAIVDFNVQTHMVKLRRLTEAEIRDNELREQQK